ncbi:MAG: hypothetical protein II233_03120 [Clostridia bacterium]|nr:hypothetical protein [Clostridia bacterium]MEE1124500.1 hypothetical protein [Acutalibacteraceae bacterium]
MKIDFKGFNEKVLTLECDSTVTTANQWVELSENGKVRQASENSPLTGVTVNSRNGYCGVMLSGVVTAQCTGEIPLGYTSLVYTADGIAHSSAGRQHLVLSATDSTVTFVL